jgi:hypothetical protein
VKGSKCQSCGKSKQPRKPHKAAKKRHLALLELMTMIDDPSRYYYVYLLKTKDEALSCFKTYKAEVENQLEKKDQMF